MASGAIPHQNAPVVEAHEEAHSRLTSLLSVCEHELVSIEALADSRLALIVERMHAFRLDLIAALEGLGQSEPDA